jgi:hypothetical protein
MVVEAKPLAQITQEAIRVLCREMGAADAARFVSQFTAGYGNYTEERDQLFAGMTLDDIVSEIKQKRRRADTRP